MMVPDADMGITTKPLRQSLAYTPAPGL